MEQIRISVSTFREIALPDFCPRCFWIKLRCNNQLPYQSFPGIFNSIDSYTKKITNMHFERYKCLPNWFADFGNLGKPQKVLYSKFNVLDDKTNILLRGIPDEILCKPDGSYFIIDYKTARFTGTQDKLLPTYEVQLNSYAYIGERVGYNPVSGLGLIYYEPLTEISYTTIDTFMLEDGFFMNFSGKLLPIELNLAKVQLLLNEVRELYDMPEAPQGVGGCENCESLDLLVKVATGKESQ